MKIYTKRPYDVRDTDEFLEMESDNITVGHFSLAHSGTFVGLHCGVGKWIEIPTDDFNKLVSWYMSPQPIYPVVEEKA